MPVKIDQNLPAFKQLESEGIFVMSHNRASNQDIRPMNILILNLMPNKIATEIQILRLLSNTPLQLNIDFLRMENTRTNLHLDKFYKNFSKISYNNYDGMIITGAPLGLISFRDVTYWEEIKKIINWTQKHVTSTLFICWAVQAALNILYGVDKVLHKKKITGIFEHQTIKRFHPLIRGFDQFFNAPHSRFSEFNTNMFEKNNLDVLCHSNEAKVYLACSKNLREVYLTGHPEYDKNTLKEEYLRDLAISSKSIKPSNYFIDSNLNLKPQSWYSHGNLFFMNWLNYCVYQRTPYSLEDVPKGYFT